VPFAITARTILQLGAELITSDAVAIYELVKNAVDARSKDGVDIEFEIVLLASDLESFQAEARQDTDLNTLKASLLSKLHSSATSVALESFRETINAARTVKTLVSSTDQLYRDLNRIVVSDHGHGMTLRDLKDIYLTIGTTHRTNAVREALQKGDVSIRAPYLGEKGVGRLSAMRLGRHLLVETTTEADQNLNIIEIDWTKFERAYDKPASSIEIRPRKGAAKPAGTVAGTRITISDLRASWPRKRLEDVVTSQLTRMTDPFSWSERRRFQIRIKYNGEVVEHTRVIAKELLRNAHAKCHGSYTIGKEGPKLSVSFEAGLYGATANHQTFDRLDILSMSGLVSSGQGSAALDTVGPFDFEIYWFNRQRLRAFEGVGDREAVRALVKAWGGICLFRDGYRVLPYGDQGDDWLGLDIEALAASGYRLNTKQLIGRVRIGRLTNPMLLDQTNRQGLQDCPEKTLLVGLLGDVISQRWRRYLDEAGRALKSKDIVDFDPAQATTAVTGLEDRARTSIRAIRRNYTGPEEVLQQVTDAFKELRDAHVRAVDRIGAMEEEKERLTQLAGVGLMIEVVAHELTRAIEHTERTLKSVDRKRIDPETSATFRALEQQIRSIHKRLQILEPLTVSARQRRTYRNLVEIVQYVCDAHVAQFERHGIKLELPPENSDAIDAFVVEGHVVQILENLIANSIYWLCKISSVEDHSIS
jgi:signal transduction histidine kinase